MAKQISDDIKSLLDPTLEYEIDDEAQHEKDTYYLITGVGEVEAVEAVVKRPANGAPVVILLDSVIVEPPPGALPPDIQRRFFADRQPEPFNLDNFGFTFDLGPGSDRNLQGAVVRTQSEIDDLVFDSARAGVGDQSMNSRERSPKATKGGRLACAWAVNRVVERALGKPVGGGLSTANMFRVLRKSDRRIAGPIAGCVIISPTEGTKTGHVGLVGQGRQVFSNSSARGDWEQNFSLKRWAQYFDAKRLPTHFFDLNPGRFPGAGV